MIDNEKTYALNNAKLFSETIISKLKNIFCDTFGKEDGALFSWGSLARREMCLFSDLDIIIFFKKPSLKKINKFKESLITNFPDNKIDLLQSYSVEDLIKIAKLDGGDRQAVTLARFELGNHELREKFASLVAKDLFSKDDIVRELLYTAVNLIKVYPQLFSSDDLKFCQYGTRYINFAFLYSRYLHDGGAIDTQSALKVLLKNQIISRNIYFKSIFALNYFIKLRNIVQAVNKKEYNIWAKEYSDYVAGANDKVISVEAMLLESKDGVRQLIESIFFDFADNIISKFSHPYNKLVLNLLFNYSKKLDTSALESGGDRGILLMLLAYSSGDKKLLDDLCENNPINWYIIFGIANNMAASPLTLDKLVRPVNRSRKIVELYDSFAWRNIYLYVARNPSSFQDTLEYIINRKKSREMDVEAAKDNIKMKKYGLFKAINIS